MSKFKIIFSNIMRAKQMDIRAVGLFETGRPVPSFILAAFRRPARSAAWPIEIRPAGERKRPGKIFSDKGALVEKRPAARESPETNGFPD